MYRTPKHRNLNGRQLKIYRHQSRDQLHAIDAPLPSSLARLIFNWLIPIHDAHVLDAVQSAHASYSRKKLAKTGNSFMATANQAVRSIYLLSYADRPVRDIYALEMMGQTVLLSLIISLALDSTATSSSHINVFFIEKAVKVAYMCIFKVPTRSKTRYKQQQRYSYRTRYLRTKL